MAKKKLEERKTPIDNISNIFDDNQKRKNAQKTLIKAKMLEKTQEKTHKWVVFENGKTLKLVRIITTLLLFFTIVGHSQEYDEYTYIGHIGSIDSNAEMSFKVLKTNVNDSKEILVKIEMPVKFEIIKGKNHITGGEIFYHHMTFFCKSKTMILKRRTCFDSDGEMVSNKDIKDQVRIPISGMFKEIFNLICK